MGLRVNNNITSINAQRNLANTTERLAKSLQRLSSGLRITRASDDAAGLAISENFRAEIRSLGQAQRNANDGISLLQIAEGALNETSGILIRMRELAIQSANGTLDSAARTTVDNEFQDLLGEINRIAQVTEFNGTTILNDVSVQVVFQIGANNTTADQISVSGVLANASGLALGTVVGQVAASGTTTGIAPGGVAAVATGFAPGGVAGVATGLAPGGAATGFAPSGIASGAPGFPGGLPSGGISSPAVASGGITSPGTAAVPSGGVSSPGSAAVASGGVSSPGTAATAFLNSQTAVDVGTLSGAQNSLARLDGAISQVASLRATFGTVQNRLESTIRSLAVAIENTQAAESRIRDVDVASETAELTRNQVLQQAGIAILAQANVSTQSALTLLQ